MNTTDSFPRAAQGRRRFLTGAAGAAAGVLARPLFAAQGFPSKPIRLVIGVPPGGILDLVVRAASTEASNQLGQPFVIENKSGGGGVPGFVQLKNSPPDGYSLGVINLSAFRMPVVLPDPGYDPAKDFTYIASLMDISFCVVVRADSPFKTWEDLHAFGVAQPEKVQYGAPIGLGSSSHLFVEEVTSREKLKWVPVPYRGSADSMQALLGGQLVFSVDTLFSCAPYVRAGKLRILATATEERQKSWPDVPTMRELGYGVTIDSSVGIAGPAGMDAEVVKTLQESFRFAMAQPSVTGLLAQGDQQPRYMDARQYTAFANRAIVYQRELLGRYGFAAKKN